MKLNWKIVKPIAIKVATAGLKFTVATGTGIIVKSIVETFATPQSRIKRVAVGIATAVIVSKVNNILDKYVEDEVQELKAMVCDLQTQPEETPAPTSNRVDNRPEEIVTEPEPSKKRNTRRRSPKPRKIDPQTAAEIQAKLDLSSKVDDATRAVFANAFKKGII